MSPSRRIGAYLIGEELLLGKRQDKHLAHVIETLAQRNLSLDFVHMIGDDEQAIAELLRASLSEDAWVVSFGGIGATPDDRTRQAVALASGVPLERHPEAVSLIEGRFGAEAYPQRIRMAELPSGCSLIPNPYNQIPGFSVAHHHFVPGFPQMAWDMLDWVLKTRYAHWRGEDLVEFIIQVMDAKESVLVPIQERLLAEYPGVAVSSLPRMSEVPDDESFTHWVELGLRGRLEDVRRASVVLCEFVGRHGFEYREVCGLHSRDK